MKKFAIPSSLALLGVISLASLHDKPAIAQCGWGDITCNPEDWTCPPGGCMEPPKPRPNPRMQAQTVDTVIIQTPVNGRALDFNSSSNNKEPVILVNYHGGESQQWSLEKLPNGRYLIKSKVNGRVLNFTNSENNKEPVILTNEHRGHSQQWVFKIN